MMTMMMILVLVLVLVALLPLGGCSCGFGAAAASAGGGGGQPAAKVLGIRVHAEAEGLLICLAGHRLVLEFMPRHGGKAPIMNGSLTPVVPM